MLVREKRLKEVTIKGGAPGAALMALNDDEFNGGDINTSYFFDLKDVKLTLKDITLKNMNRQAGNGAGGMIYVNPYSELVLDNVIVKNVVVDAGVNCRGGAIWSEGKLTVKNSIFENCKAFQGGAIFLKETEMPLSASFENSIFRNNQTVNGTVVDGTGAGGGAFWIDGKNIDVLFDKCFFDSNYAKNKAKNANSGGIRLEIGNQCNANVTFSNCTIANNKSDGSSGFLRWIRPDNGIMNLKFINNVMYKNRTSGPQANIITSQRPTINTGLSGSMIFVNNTSIMNNTGADGLVLADQTAINLTDFGGNFDMIFVNNILLDCMTEPITIDATTVVDQMGYGWAIRETDGRSTGTYIIQNNVVDGVGGSYSDTWGNGFLYYFLNTDAATANYNKSIRGKTTDQKLNQVGISRVLSSSESSVTPYIEINSESAYAIDNGISSLIYKGQELIPQTDMRGVPIGGSFKDLGAFEYNSFSSVPTVKGGTQVMAFLNPWDNILYFSKEIISAKIYSISGSCLKSASNTKSMHVESLEKGIYLVQIVDNQGNSYTHKILK